MPKARNPNRDKAYEIWVASNFKIKLKDIAAQLNETESTIRKWKCTDKWEQKANGALPKEKKSAPKGNRTSKEGQNQKKCGAPLRNTNAVKHGGYRKIYTDSLTAEELDLIKNAPDDEEYYLCEQIAMYTVSERRLLTAIKKVMNGVAAKNENGEDIISDRILNTAGLKTETGGMLGISTTTRQINYEHTDNRYLRLQAELTKVQRAKTKCIEALSRLHLEKERLELLKDDNEVEIEDTSDIEGVIYG